MFVLSMEGDSAESLHVDHTTKVHVEKKPSAAQEAHAEAGYMSYLDSGVIPPGTTTTLSFFAGTLKHLENAGWRADAERMIRERRGGSCPGGLWAGKV